MDEGSSEQSAGESEEMIQQKCLMATDDTEDMTEEIEAAFGFFDPSEKDFDSLCELLRQQFRDITLLDISGLADTIIKQVNT